MRKNQEAMFFYVRYNPNYEPPKKFRWDSAGNGKKREDENAEKKNA